MKSILYLPVNESKATFCHHENCPSLQITIFSSIGIFSWFFIGLSSFQLILLLLIIRDPLIASYENVRNIVILSMYQCV